MAIADITIDIHIMVRTIELVRTTLQNRCKVIWIGRLHLNWVFQIHFILNYQTWVRFNANRNIAHLMSHFCYHSSYLLDWTEFCHNMSDGMKFQLFCNQHYQLFPRHWIGICDRAIEIENLTQWLNYARKKSEEIVPSKITALPWMCMCLCAPVLFNATWVIESLRCFTISMSRMQEATISPLSRSFSVAPFSCSLTLKRPSRSFSVSFKPKALHTLCPIL